MRYVNLYRSTTAKEFLWHRSLLPGSHIDVRSRGQITVTQNALAAIEGRRLNEINVGSGMQQLNLTQMSRFGTPQHFTVIWIYLAAN
jgi:hypothetical protein